jgi:transposase
MARRNQRYPPELRERALRMVAEVTPNYDSEWAAMNTVAQKLGVGTAEIVRKRVRQAEVGTGQRVGTSSEEAAEIKRLKRGVAELRRGRSLGRWPSRRGRRSPCSRPTAVTSHRCAGGGRGR